MKNLLFLILSLITLGSCSDTKQSNPPEKSDEKIEDFSYLLGSWQRTNEQEGRATFENWQKKSPTEYIGLGYTMAEGDTVWQEDVKLIQREGAWNFEVTGKGESTATIFKLTQIEKGQFVCENEENEFPKKIHYFTNGENISATISGGDMEILFEFEKMNQN